jgi:hypothetical protein
MTPEWFQNSSEPVPNQIGSAVPTFKGGTAPELLTGTARALPFGLTFQQWQTAIATDWLGMTTTAADRLGQVAPWKGTPSGAVARRPQA